MFRIGKSESKCLEWESPRPGHLVLHIPCSLQPRSACSIHNCESRLWYLKCVLIAVLITGCVRPLSFKGELMQLEVWGGESETGSELWAGVG